MPSMRVAVAGTCLLALLIAREVHQSTTHQVIILSRINQPVLKSQGYQCQVIDYGSSLSLQHALMGVDTVISTVTGSSQLRLIEAAVQCRVRRFAPAEFEGPPGLQVPHNVLDRNKSAARILLRGYSAYMQSTAFICGVLYERFAVGGLRAHQMGARIASGEGDYIADLRNMTAVAPIYDATNNLSSLCLTSAYDVARFVVKSLDMANWPAEMTICGERMTVHALLRLIETCRGRSLNSVEWQNPSGLRYQVSIAKDIIQQQRTATHLATAEGHYDFILPADLNSMYPDVVVTGLQTWLTQTWAGIP